MNRHIRVFVFSLLVMVVIVFLAIGFTVTYYTNDFIIEVLISNGHLPLPLIIYLLLYVFIVTVVFNVVIKLFQRHKIKRVEKALTQLIEGYYTSNLMNKMAYSDKEQITSKVDQLFVELQTKLVNMSKEVLLAKEEQSQVSTETREEILEAERRRIARELHDSVSQQLFASSMILSAINEQDALLEDNPNISSQLHNVEKIINESQSEMRALLLHLRPVKLNTKNLKEGIEQLLVELSTKIHMKINYEIEDISLPMSTEDNLFRIVQELLSNVLRHSKAKELEVYLKKIDQRVQLRVIDDGVGFDLYKEHSGSYGLPNIKERISGLGGNVKIISFPNQGTSVDISIPVDLEENSDTSNIN